MKVTLKQENSGLVKQAKVGFSWTTFFFGFIVPIVRGDWKWALIMFVVATLTFGISVLVFPFIYNKLYIRELISSGYKASDDNSDSILKSRGIIFA